MRNLVWSMFLVACFGCGRPAPPPVKVPISRDSFPNLIDHRGVPEAAEDWSIMPFPTVAANDPEFSEGYWRGLVWLDQVFFAIEGLEMYGFTEDADALTAQVLGNLEGAAVPGEPLYENYHPLTGEGRNVRHFSWTAAHLLLLSMESQ